MTQFTRTTGLRLAAAALMSALAAGSASAQSVADFYAGKTMIQINGSAPGGGYDTMGRLIAQHMVKHIPGNPKMIVKNLPGAGGIKAMTNLATVAPRDGLTIGMVQRDVLTAPLLAGDGYNYVFDPLKLTYIGSPTQDVGMVIASTRKGVKTIQEAMKVELIAAATGANSGPAVIPRILNSLIGTKFKVLIGYKGSGATRMAMERGEADAFLPSGFSGPNMVQSEALRDKGVLVFLLQLGLKRNPRYPEVPHIFDLAKNDDDRKLMNLLFLSQAFGRPVLAPPGIPADRAKALRAAFDATMTDPAFIADAKKRKSALDPITGAQMEELLRDAYATPKAVLAKAVAIVKQSRVKTKKKKK